MDTVERSIDVRADTAAVWAVLADFASIARWAPNVDHSCLLTDQAEGVGMVRRIQTGRTTVVETVEHWEPGTSLGYTITGLPPVIKSVTNVWTLDPIAEGTRVTLTTDVDAGSRPPQRGVAKIVGRKLAQASDQMLAGLRDHTAADSPAGVNS